MAEQTGVIENSTQLNKVNLKEVTIVPHTGDATIDLRPNIMEMAIYEDIFSHYLKATIVYVDAAGLIETLPIIGEEFVVVSIQTQGKSGYCSTSEFTFYCHSIEKRERLEDRSEAYVLNLVSPEAIVNEKSSSNRAHIGKSIRDIVFEEYKEHFYNNEWTWGRNSQLKFLGEKIYRPTIYTAQTDGLHSFVSPGMQPIEFMNYLASQAYSSEYPESDFIFFRDSFAYNFVTFSEMFQKEPVESYYYINPNILPQDEDGDPNQVVKKHQIIYNFGFKTMPSHIKRLRSGAYQNEISTLNLVTKEYRTKTFNYYDEFHRNPNGPIFTNLGGKSLMSKFSVNKNFDENFNDGYPFSRFFLTDSSRNDVAYLENKDKDQYINYPNLRERFSNLRTSKMGQIKNGNRLWLSVSGDNELKVGQVINVFIPQNATTEELFKKYNLLFTGNQKTSKFLITALVHNYNKVDDEFITRIECVNDSYETDFEKIEKYFRNNEETFT